MKNLLIGWTLAQKSRSLTELMPTVINVEAFLCERKRRLLKLLLWQLLIQDLIVKYESSILNQHVLV